MKNTPNKPNKMFYLFLILSWIFSGFFLFIFFKNSGWLPKTPVTIYDLTYLIVFFVFFVLPFINRFKLGQLEVESKLLEESESEDENDVDVEGKKKKHKKKHKPNKKGAWFTFIKRAFVGTMDARDIARIWNFERAEPPEQVAEVIES